MRAFEAAMTTSRTTSLCADERLIAIAFEQAPCPSRTARSRAPSRDDFVALRPAQDDAWRSAPSAIRLHYATEFCRDFLPRLATHCRTRAAWRRYRWCNSSHRCGTCGKNASPCAGRVDGAARGWFGGLMKLAIHADIDLTASLDGAAHVTWFDARVDGGEQAKPALEARAALVHVGEIADALGDLWPALHAARLESVHDTYFSDGWYKDDYADGAGIDLLYVERVEVADAWRDKNLDIAAVRRLAETLGSSCQLVVMPYRDALEAAYWARLGFTPSTPGRTSGLMHMKLGVRHARVVDARGSGEFEVVGDGSRVRVNEWAADPLVRRRACN
jgi:hypothetical protein